MGLSLLCLRALLLTFLFTSSLPLSAAAPPSQHLNVLGTPLLPCSTSPRTGFYRSGRCETGPDDADTHTVCAVMTDRFLQFTKARGNDLTSVVGEGDRWCLCALRWNEAADAGVAPTVVLRSTHAKTLAYVTLARLRASTSE